MSDLAGAMPAAAVYEGYVRIAEEGARSMIVLRGDFGGTMLETVATRLTGLVMPKPGRFTANDEGKALFWMSPDELLAVENADPAKRLAAFAEALPDPSFSVVDVSHARVRFSVSGDDALVREVLAKLAPVDLAPGRFEPGMFRRTRLGQVAAAFWMVEAGRIEIVCFRSVAVYVFQLLSEAARPGGEIRMFA